MAIDEVAEGEEQIGQEVVGDAVEPGPGQEGLFERPVAEDPSPALADEGAGWALGATGDEPGEGPGDEGEYAEATLVGDDDLETETAPIATIDELMGDVASPDTG